MDSVIQGQLDRIDAALNSLVESIASYNPSVTAANDLLAADDELCKGVKTLSRHQANHTRILYLRSQVSCLNNSITNALTTLADTRNEILTQDVMPANGTSYSVPYKDLLNYAARISRYTQPTGRQSAKVAKNSQEASAVINGGEDGSRTQEAQSALKEEQVEQAESSVGPFVPWPTEGIIKQGALGRIQAMLEAGQDLSSIDYAEIHEIKAEEILMDEAVPAQPVKEHEMERREPKAEQKPKVFGSLDLYDPDDMEDE